MNEPQEWEKLDLVDQQKAIDLLNKIDNVVVMKEAEEECEDSTSKE